ncbi:hypothetical protein JYU34_008748 [Plutella xylostella]|uniref:Uncharacterized protein n=1 Tax=Plutella xylostella TaxID=51655 RepID=A0ABQ7QMM3_PLUXY|nr:hypothetical protein JYU34_008748 [Plutella xylostella]
MSVAGRCRREGRLSPLHTVREAPAFRSNATCPGHIESTGPPDDRKQAAANALSAMSKLQFPT